MILALLVACGPKIDPLQPMVHAVAKAKRAQPTANPHARFVLAESTVQDLVLELINPDKPIVMPVMLGTVAAIRVDLDRPSLALKAGAACNCTVADVRARGTLDVDIAGLLGKQQLAKNLGFSATVVGSPQFGIVPMSDGRTAIQMSGHPSKPWSIDLDLTEERGFLTNELIDKQFEKPMAAMLQKPMSIAKLPATLPVLPRKLALQTAADPTIDLWLAAESSQAPAPPIAVERGWGLSLTDGAVVAMLRAVLTTREQHPRWKLEPISVELRGDRFRSVVRVHRVSHKIQYRDYNVVGGVVSDTDGFNIVPESVEEIGKVGWKGSLVGGFVTPQVRKQILAQTIGFPRVFETPDARIPTRWTVRSLTADDTGIYLLGDLEILSTPKKKTK